MPIKQLIKLYLDRPELAALAILVVFVVVFQIKSNGLFLSITNLRGLLGLVPEIALVAAGVGLLMIAGEFDLSVGSVFAFTPMTIFLMLNAGVPVALGFLIGLLLSCFIGLINGLITIHYQIPSFIVTLGMLFAVRSLTIVISGGFPPPFPTDAPTAWFVSFIGPLRLSLFWFIGLAVLMSVLLNQTNFGNWVRACGGQIGAAASMGIPTVRVKLICFMLSAMFAGFAGTIQVLRLGAALPSIGTGLELQAVAACVVGGIALTGGIGTILCAVIGAILIEVIKNGLALTGVESSWFKFAIGTLTIFAVILNSVLRRFGKRIRLETTE